LKREAGRNNTDSARSPSRSISMTHQPRCASRNAGKNVFDPEGIGMDFRNSQGIIEPACAKRRLVDGATTGHEVIGRHAIPSSRRNWCELGQDDG
jgi:hypothetical protein